MSDPKPPTNPAGPSPIDSEDATVFLQREEVMPRGSAHRTLRLTLPSPDGEVRTYRTRKAMTLGSHPSCDLVLNDVGVSKRHAELYLDDGRWWVRDLGSTNGTRLDAREIECEPLEDHSVLRLVPKGRPITCDFVDPDPNLDDFFHTHDGASVTDIFEQLFHPKAGSRPLTPREVRLREAAERARHVTKRNARKVILALAVVLTATVGVVVLQHRRLTSLSSVAVDVFFEMKQLRERVAQTGSPELQQQLDELEQRYDRMLLELGLVDSDQRPEERSILAMARVFGECEVTAPDDFVATVEEYIERWRSGTRLEQAVARLDATGRTAELSDLLLESGLPPEFLYLAIQESDFLVEAVGPRTRFGIAKGPWQFLPVTAREMGLETGPLVEMRAFDPLDERYDLLKATRAAGRYLRELYDTDAQHSGLLVLASYNWGQGNLRRRLRELPRSPRERNFWKLLQTADVPQETLDYVFNILSAAVIGSDPELFGFSFAPPLRSVGDASVATSDSS